MSSYFKFGLTRKIIVLIVSALILNTLIVALFVGLQVHRISTNFLLDALEQETEYVVERVDQFFAKHGLIAEQQASNRFFINALKELETSERVIHDPLYPDIVRDLIAIKSPQSFTNLIYLAVDSQNTLITNRMGYEPRSSFVLSERAWYQDAVASSEYVISDPYIDLSTGKPAITISKAIRDSNHELLGAIGLDILLDDLYEELNAYGVGETGYISIVNRDGLPVYHPEESVIFDDEAPATYLQSLINGEAIDGTDENGRYFSYHQMSETDWYAVAVIDEEEISGPVQSLMQLLGTILFLTTGLFVGIAYVTTKKLTDPLHHLTAKIKQETEEWEKIEIPDPFKTREDEIGELSRTLSSMGKRIRQDLIEANEQNERLLDEVESHKLTQNQLKLMLSVLARTDQAFFIMDVKYTVIYHNETMDQIMIKHTIDIPALVEKLDVSSDSLASMYDEESINHELVLDDHHYDIGLQAFYYEGTLYILGTVEDKSQIIEAYSMIAHLRTYDAFTGLMNKQAFLDHVEKEITRVPLKGACMVLCNINGFRTIQEAKGLEFANNLIFSLRDRLQESLQEGEAIGRTNVEFAMFLLIEEGESIEERLETITARAMESYEIDGEDTFLNLAFGASVYSDKQDTSSQLLDQANAALNHNKDPNEQAVFTFYDERINQMTAYQFMIFNRLQTAVEREEFELHMQPQINAESGRIVGMEALLRWHHEDSYVRPDVFIPIAEKYGIMIKIGDWVLEESMRIAASFAKRGHTVPISVNISGSQFRDPAILSKLDTYLHQTKFDPALLKLELTESILIDDEERCMDVLDKIRNRGIRVSIDDFGTGYSSLSYLKRLNVNELKIDRSFIKGIPKEDNGDITELIISLANKLKLSLVAEGVEEKEQIDFLVSHGCKTIQGYYYYKPMPVSDIEDLLMKNA
ncbi:bifunctional diguanylate cyclase/phosphodiesterase [Salisediminibacterium selenitireducens]|uniref:Diguanylate cyclase/phosphodiesterase with extracellular sensor n=1 Tax=Bacillus selenitireducens (strain ATCC 700615 / DSM 15326 / MLS10) TaxID=439292 RepID=D6XXV5_BACIE|nr:EAL domain-containing protein [Salisediminibacterium selenitireducens]ADI00148.1 diguanylate cyclase/phosphodiesterase with extracellular sensor [[Bacillus] selenitireducens MLS10]